MRMKRAIAFASLVGLLCCGAVAQEESRVRDKPADTAELAQITTRGKAIAAYDNAAWHATDTVQALHPPDSEVGVYIGAPTSEGLVMGFGHLNEGGTKFLLAYEVRVRADAEHPTLKHNEPALEDDGVWLHLARAFELVKPLVKGLGGAYNIAILPADRGKWFVYAYPAQTVNGVYPTGADTRYLISADGIRVEATHKMHYSLLSFEKPKDDKTVSTYRTAVIDDAPEDTDVATVLMMGGVPCRVVTKKFVYQIAADGDIKYVIQTDVFMKDAKKGK